MVNTVTLYRSPLRLIHHTAEDAAIYSAQAISRARKKMMAEIALAGDEIIIDDISYSRNDASTLLDFITEESWKTHSIIYSHKGLLAFLEREEFNNEELRKADAYLYNSAFVQAVSPYFAHSFNTVSGKLIRQENFEELWHLLNYQGYVLPEHSHEAYQKIRTYLDELNYTLRNLSWEKFYGDETILHFIFSDEWKRFINKLPTSFTAQRDELVEQMTGIVLRFQHKATWYYLHQVMLQLKQIETNDFNRSEVERIDHVMDDNTKVEGGRRKALNDDSSGWSWRSVWWVIWIIITIVRIATCNEKNNRSSVLDNYYYENRAPTTNIDVFNERRNEQSVMQFLDSLCQAPSRSLQSIDMETGDQPFTQWAETTDYTRNDSVIITNTSGHDAVMLYCKDVPGHYNSGVIPKFYATYIEKGDAEMVYVQPGNGRLYFMFGDGWCELKNTIVIPLQNAVRNNLTGSDMVVSDLELTHFFKRTISDTQTFLKSPLLIQYQTIMDDQTDAERTTTKIFLNKGRKGFGFTSNSKNEGWLMVKQVDDIPDIQLSE